MLQWMGGSRRKVTTTRKSTQKRQKQYFEQRRRLQQQEESEEGGVGSYAQNCNQHQQRSLDILNLRNLSSISHRGDPTENASPPKHHTREDQPVILDNPTVRRPESREIDEPRTNVSGNQTKAVSPHKARFSSLESHSHAFNNVVDSESDLWKTEKQQRLCLFGLLGEDAADGNFEVNPMHEAHVAFSVEGLGKVGEETPPHSPQQPDRYVSRACSSSLTPARKFRSSKKHNHIIDVLEREVDVMMHDINTPLRGSSLEFSTGFDDSYISPKSKISLFREHEQFDCHRNDLGNTFLDTKSLGKTENTNEDLWDASSRVLDANLLDGWESDMSWKSWRYGMDNDSENLWNNGDDEISEYAFDCPYLPRNRNGLKVTRELNTLESPIKHGTSARDHSFISTKGARHNSTAKAFYFRDTTSQPDWSHYVTEDARDKTMSLSEESCSSSAVMGEPTNVSLPIPSARYSTRQGNGSGHSGIDCGMNNIFAKGRDFEKKDYVQKGNKKHGSGKSAWTLAPSESESGHSLNFPLKEKITPCKRLLFDEGCKPETKINPLCFKPCAEDMCNSFPDPELHIGSEVCFKRNKHDCPVKSFPSSSFISERFPHCHPSSHKNPHESPTRSKFEFRETEPDFWPDNDGFELKVQPAGSSHDTVLHGEELIPDLAAWKSLRKDEKNKSNFQQANYENFEAQHEILVLKQTKTMDALDSEVSCPECIEAKDETAETSSSVKIPDKYESTVDEIKYHHDAEIPVSCQYRNEGPGEEEIVSKRERGCLDTPSHVMMLESYVVQLCVQKVLKEASVHRTP